MNGNFKRAFDVISPPPKVLLPRSDDGEFGMKGVLLPKILQARTDGFITMSPPPKTAAGISARHFDVTFPSPKIRSLDAEVGRRANV
jgi:hypothetical protein